MTGVEKFLLDIKFYSTSFVTIGDGAKGEIKGVGKLVNNGLPKLDDVLLVKGLTVNLISDVLMKGVKSKDNCYLWVPQESAYYSTCLMTKEVEVNLWHQKHDSLVERVTDVEEDVGTSSQQTYVLDKESNIESGGIDYEESS
ncbi:gag-pol polyprotein [Trifolium medium]|uniref:Gag-pol polyprotein n=1 Tax=Trifolium medium TaxID=97028 RepID=A0A392Q217_9FABA|nr:gag-pol polyprotein [Trifolium medium]